MRATEVCVVERACFEYLEYSAPEVFTQKASATPYFVGTATRRLVAAVPPRYREARRALREHLDAWSPFGFMPVRLPSRLGCAACWRRRTGRRGDCATAGTTHPGPVTRPSDGGKLKHGVFGWSRLASRAPVARVHRVCTWHTVRWFLR